MDKIDQNPNDVLRAALKARLGVAPKRERKLSKFRLWRFDLVYTTQGKRIAIEIDGRQHLRYANHRRDCEKRNAAVEAGWIVLAYPANTVLTKSRLPMVVEQIARVVCGINDQAEAAGIITGKLK